MREKKLSWQVRLKENNIALVAQVQVLQERLRMMEKELDLLRRLINGPPTMLIACEKITEASAQLATTASLMLREKIR